MPKHRNAPKLPPVQAIPKLDAPMTPEQEKRLWKILGQDAPPETPEEKYDKLVGPALAEIAKNVMAMGMSMIALVDYGEPNDLNTGITIHMQDVVSPLFTLAVLAARSGGNFDTLVSLMRQINPSHNSIVLSLLGFPLTGVPEEKQPVTDELQAAYRLLQSRQMFTAANVIEEALSDTLKG